MRQYKYEDQEAKRYGKVITATMVHHIYPVTDYPELRLKSWNLIPLTAATHNKMHDRDTDKIIGPGLYWQRKRRKDFDNFYHEHDSNNSKEE
ncbi:MAG: HNH endonuclease [Lactobacillus sp.]|jgi:5-methylcytosine-specific restriction endonuclease McrA|nr:HNH endonuclease [Lactobacillus sp.]